VPYIGDASQWPGQQIDAVELDLMIIHLRRARVVYGDAAYAEAIRRLPRDAARSDLSALLYPDA
jgi:hypothetical protein